MTTLEMLKMALEALFIKHEPEPLLPLFAEELCCYGIGDGACFTGLSAAEEWLRSDECRRAMERHLTLGAQEVAGADSAVVCFTLAAGEDTVSLRLMGASRVTASGRKLFLLHLTRCETKQPRRAHSEGEVLSREKERTAFIEQLVDTMSASMATYTVSEDGMRLIPRTLSENLGQHTGLDREQYRARYAHNAMDSVYEGDRSQVARSIRETLESGRPCSLTFRTYHAVRGLVWTNASYARCEEAGQRAIRAVFTPATQQFELQRQALETENTGVCVVDEKTREIYYANDTLFRLLGMETWDYAGQTCYELFRHREAACAWCSDEMPADQEIEAKGRCFALHTEHRVWNDRQVLVLYSRDITEQKRLGERLEQGRRVMQIASTFARIWILSYDPVTHVCYPDKRLQEEFGFPAELPGFPESALAAGFLLPQYHRRYCEAFHRLEQGETRVDFDVQTKYPDGGIHWVRFRGQRMTEPGVSSMGAVISAQEIDAEKAMELRLELEARQQLEGGSNLLAHFVTNLTRGVPVEHCYRFDERPELLEWSSIEEQRANVEKYIVNRRKREEFHSLHETKALLDAFDRGECEKTMTYRRIFPDGRTLWVQSVLHLMLDPRSGDVLNYEYLYDVHQQKMSDELMSAVVAFGFERCASLMTDTDQVTLLLSPGEEGAARLKVAKYTEINAAYADTVLPEDRESYLAACSLENITTRLKTEDHFEAVHRTLENGVIHYKKDQCYGYSDERSLCLLIRSDITQVMAQERSKQEELQKALEAAEAATMAKSEFLSRMSHEIRTPMNAIIGMTAIARESDADFRQVTECLEKIDLSSHFLLTLINDILEMSRIESGRIEIRHAAFDFHTLVESIRTVVEPLAMNSGLRYEFLCDAPVEAQYIGDAMRIQQVLVNLITNAVKFTKGGGRVRFSVSTGETTETQTVFRFVVADTGIGMSESFMQRMFRPFTQEETGNTSRYGGSGLGLAISKSLTEAMGGNIAVESYLGVGSTFTVTLPLDRVPSSEQAEQPAAAAQVDETALQGVRVLMAEDHPLNVTVACKLLARKGVTVTVAENGKEAVERFTAAPQGSYDAILMDIRMPVLDGLDAARAIRALSRPDAKTIPIIAMTANALEEDRRNSEAAGMNAHLAKPFDPAQLYQVLAGQIEAAKKKQAESASQKNQ